MKHNLYEKLNELAKSDIYPFHMPGHKRQLQEKPFDEITRIDITEITDFDDLHEPEGILKEEQDFAAALYGADHTYYIVNGSTCGILTAISAVCRWGDTIVMARNCHKSVYHAAYLQNLQIEYVEPQRSAEGYPAGPVLSEEIENALQRAEKKQAAKAVILTSPTYEGVLSDIPAIAEIVHAHHAVLIVDEAHGAHLGFSSEFPQSAVRQGANLIVQSLHKTLPAMTQTALLHICGNRVDPQRVQQYLDIYETSSPSYVMMASMSKCLHLIDEEKDSVFADFYEKLQDFYKIREQLKHITILDAAWAWNTYHACMDPSKINICVAGCMRDGSIYTGKMLSTELLRKYHIETEMTAEQYVIAMTSVMDTQKGFDRLRAALLEIDSKLSMTENEETEIAPSGYRETELSARRTSDEEKNRDFSCKTEKVVKNDAGQSTGQNSMLNDEEQEAEHRADSMQTTYTIRQAMDHVQKAVDWKEAVGRISAEFVIVYPPGAPLLVPGEVITQALYEKVRHYQKVGLNLQGMQDRTLQSIRIITE